MGFYPKRLRRRQHMRNMKLIATAALSGCTFVSGIERRPTGRFNYNGDETYSLHAVWTIHYSDGQSSHNYDTKSIAAAHYLVWWFQKQNVWPRYRV